MKTIKAIKNFTVNDKYFDKNDIVTGVSFNQIVELNEKGYIEPLTRKDLQEIREGKNNKKEEE